MLSFCRFYSISNGFVFIQFAYKFHIISEYHIAGWVVFLPFLTLSRFFLQARENKASRVPSNQQFIALSLQPFVLLARNSPIAISNICKGFLKFRLLFPFSPPPSLPLYSILYLSQMYPSCSNTSCYCCCCCCYDWNRRNFI